MKKNKKGIMAKLVFLNNQEQFLKTAGLTTTTTIM